MPLLTPERVLDKVHRLHSRLNGSEGAVSFVLDEITSTDFFGDSDSVSPTTTSVSPVPIVRDVADDELREAFGSEIGPDSRFFTFVSDSLVSRNPTSTLSQRAQDFLLERANARSGRIVYNNRHYVIKGFVAKLIVAGIPVWFVVHAVAQRRSS